MFAVFAASCVGAVALSVYMIGLDSTIRARFEGKRWALPARVYARPLELFVGMPMSADQFDEELGLSPYRGVEAPRLAGTYSRDEQKFEIYTRAFTFWDGVEPSRRVLLSFDSGRLASLGLADGAPAPALMRLEPAEIASIYPAHGEDRVLVKGEAIPPVLVDTLIAVEDRSFYDHFGVDFRGITRAFVANLRAGRTVQGGSTLTQQLVKNFFLSSERTITRKLNEMLMALLIEWHYGKNEILEAYANEIYLGQEGGRAIHGFGLAAQFYFDRALPELDLHHLALMIGLIQGPSRFDPRRVPELAKQRRGLVLDVMVARNLISREDALTAKNMPLDVAPIVQRANTRYPAFMDLVRQQLRDNYREEDLTSEGLRVFTTLDPRTQQVSERSLVEMMPKLEKKAKLEQGLLQGAAVITDSQTGEVRAIVGDRKVRQAGFNRALSAKRPAGSLLKPAVYLTAIEEPRNYTLATLLDDANPLSFTTRQGDVWEPQNYDEKMHGWVMLRDALAKSYNIPTARLGLELDLTQVVKTMQRMGLQRDLPPYPSLVLGAVDVSPFEVAQLYSAFASGGYRLPLRAITEVVSANGKPLPRLYSLTLQKAMDPGPAYLITSALQRVVTGGTARSANTKLSPDLGLAGKTGTTDELRDSWFAGFSGNLLSVVWVGRDDNQPAELSGAKGALQIWIELMRQLPLEPLLPIEPADVESILIDPVSGQLASNLCEGAQWVPFLLGSTPVEFAPCARGVDPEAAPGDPDNPKSLSTFFRRLLE